MRPIRLLVDAPSAPLPRNLPVCWLMWPRVWGNRMRIRAKEQQDLGRCGRAASITRRKGRSGEDAAVWVPGTDSGRDWDQRLSKLASDGRLPPDAERLAEHSRSDSRTPAIQPCQVCFPRSSATR
jgi:hypothetical protein